MSALFKQPEWSIEEIVLLAKLCEDITAMKIDLEKAAEQLSSQLRYGAELMGISISSRYRNVEEVKNNIKLMTTMIKMVGYLEDEYFEGTTIGHIALLTKNNKENFNKLLESAVEIFPSVAASPHISESTNSDISELKAKFSGESFVVSEPEIEFKGGKKRRPHISIMRSNTIPFTILSSISYDFNLDKTGFTNTFTQETSLSSLMEEPQSPMPYPVQVNSYQKYIGLIKQVLLKHFQRGFRLNSAIDLKRFRAYYQSMHGKSMLFQDETLCDFISKAGFEYDGKIYIAEIVISSQLVDDIKIYLNSTFTTERGYLYYTSIYSHFEDSFLDSQIANAEMLKQYLQNVFGENYHFTDRYVARDINVNVSVQEEVISYIKNQHTIVSLEQLKTVIDFFPGEMVEQVWNVNDGLLITNGRNEKFHIDTFDISETQKQYVSYFIADALQDNPFITGDDLLVELRLKLPELFDNNNEMSSRGIRNAIAYHLKDRFSFRNNIISKISDGFDGATAMLEYCKKLGYFSMGQAENMAEVIGTPLNAYLERITEVALRVNDKDFVPLDTIKFDSEAIDKALDIYVMGDYLPIIELENFEAFPNCGEYPWNLRLLESYLLTERSRYAYYHATFLGKDTITGAIVKKSSSLRSYDDVLIQSLGESDIDLSEESANEYLYQKGLIARRQKNGPVKKILLKAKECRNRLNQQKN